jgi:hypothetical protein
MERIPVGYGQKAVTVIALMAKLASRPGYLRSIRRRHSADDVVGVFSRESPV